MHRHVDLDLACPAGVALIFLFSSFLSFTSALSPQTQFVPSGTNVSSLFSHPHLPSLGLLMQSVPTPELSPLLALVPQKKVQRSASTPSMLLAARSHALYATQVPYGAPGTLSYWWSVVKTANFWLEERVLWAHSAAWIEVDVLTAGGGGGGEEWD
jgi:hypothetical protein